MTFWHIPKILTVQLSATTRPHPPLSKIVQFVENQDFITARNALLDISPQVDYYADVQFLLATIDYLDKKPKKAATVFRTLSNIDGYIRKEQALYYFAASLIADGQVIEAKKILSLIAADAEHPKHDAAVVLLKSL
jgi:TolA-binding protein